MASNNSDSVMDISALNIEDISCLTENLSMEFVTQIIDHPKSSCPKNFVTSASKVTCREDSDYLSIINDLISVMPDLQPIHDKNKMLIKAADEQTKQLELQLLEVEKKLAIKKRELNTAIEGLQKLKEENKILENQISSYQSEQKALIKVVDELKKKQDSSPNENLADKWRVDVYRQLTGVTFGFNSNSPHELRGYAVSQGSSRNIKTFHFNTKENSSSFIGDYIWNVLEELYAKHWENSVLNK